MPEIMVQLPDHLGNSPHTSTHTIQDLADDLYEFMEDNRLLDPSHKLTLMGHSMGALAML